MKVIVNTNVPYAVTVESGVIDQVGEIVAFVKKPGRKVMLISDSNVMPIYGGRVINSLVNAGFAVSRFVFPAGEEHKLMSTVEDMYKALSQAGFTRTDLIVALGGGVTGDMAGFAAATFLRGISFIGVPTSLVAQADASLGGKTGVDLPFGKNLVGAFHQPVAVISDPDVLSTLPRQFINDGLGEVIKHGAIDDKELFEALRRGEGLSDLKRMVVRSVQIKRDYIEADTFDTGRRMILNFGHTFGHALEKLHGFSGISHGEAVGIGMVLACKVGEKLGVTMPGTAELISEVLKSYDMPTAPDFSTQEIVQATALDKKSDGEKLNFILIKDIGSSLIYPLSRADLLEALS